MNSSRPKNPPGGESGFEALRKRLQSIGVSVRETTPETRIATPMVIANSLKSLPRMPPMNSTGIKTAARETVMETTVKAISLDPFKAASRVVAPFSMCLTMFSRTTMASSTTKPTQRVSAMRDRLFKLKSNRYITQNVPVMERGMAMAGMMVAEARRRKRKITRTTSATLRSKVSWTSCTAARIGSERSI